VKRRAVLLALLLLLALPPAALAQLPGACSPGQPATSCAAALTAANSTVTVAFLGALPGANLNDGNWDSGTTSCAVGTVCGVADLSQYGFVFLAFGDSNPAGMTGCSSDPAYLQCNDQFNWQAGQSYSFLPAAAPGGGSGHGSGPVWSVASIVTGAANELGVNLPVALGIVGGVCGLWLALHFLRRFLGWR